MYTFLLFVHFVGLALSVGTGFANFTLGLATKDLPPAERGQFFLRTSVLMRNGGVGLVLLIASGLGMMTIRGFGETLRWGGGAFHAKLTLVVLIVGAFGYLESRVARARREGGGPALAKVPLIGRVMLVLALGIVLCAVLAFH
jgi:uncharacterized membrane protein